MIEGLSHSLSIDSPIKYSFIFIICFVALGILHYIALQPTTLFEQAIFILLVMTLLPLSYTTLHIILSIIPQPKKIMKRVHLSSLPKVALIQPIYNDFTPTHTTKTILNNPGFDYWILSDSDKAAEIQKEEDYCRELGLKILRRTDRSGRKAGAINEWSNNIGKFGYKYFVVLDKDSILGRENVKDLLEIAEHPDNDKIAIFQTSINSVAGETIYSHLVSTINNSLVSSAPKIDMIYLGGALYWGHNALIRAEAFLDVDGEDEQYLSEDYAFTIKLEEAGWRTQLIPEITSYEEQPRDLITAIERSNRWMKGSYGIAGLTLKKIDKISLGTIFQCLISPVFNLSTSALALMFLLVCFTPRSLFNNSIDHGLFGLSIGVLLFIYVTLNLNFSILVEAIGRRDLKDVLTLIPLNSLMSMVTLLRSLYQTICYILFRRTTWNPMRLSDKTIEVSESYRLMFPELVVGYLLMIILWCEGKFLYTIYMLPWIIAFICGPLLASYSSQKYQNLIKTQANLAI